MLTSSNYNPDVLSCIANLSSDEVFTPPQLVNRILDFLPVELWSDNWDGSWNWDGFVSDWKHGASGRD